MIEAREATASRFEAERARLHRIALRLLGSHAEAEDAVQEAWIRLDRETDVVTNVGGWLTTVVSRIALDRLRVRGRRREADLPTQLEGIIDEGAGADPAREVLLADAVGTALVVVLARLAPAERVAFVLHDLADIPFNEVASILRRSTEAARQAASRARRRLRGATTTAAGDQIERRRLVETFYAAARSGDIDGLVAILDPDGELRVDGAASPTGRPQVVRGAATIARRAGLGASQARAAAVRDVDGHPAIVVLDDGAMRMAMLFEIVGLLIRSIEIVGSWERLAAMRVVD